jgi:hypothetical protein
VSAPQRARAEEQPVDRITRREWWTAGRDLIGCVLAVVVVLVILDQWLVLLATLAFTYGWAR